MHDAIASPLESWASFYVIVGSCAGALTGLQFVVMTLIAQTSLSRGRTVIAAFGSPNVVHFCAVVLVASILSVPWRTLPPAATAIVATGVLGIGYSLIVTRRAHRQSEYRPVFEDWMWHTILPFIGYATLFVAGVLLARNPPDAMLAIGGAALLLVFIGIHNAWDTVTYVTLMSRAEPPAEAAPAAMPAESRAMAISEPARQAETAASPPPAASVAAVPEPVGPAVPAAPKPDAAR